MREIVERLFGETEMDPSSPASLVVHCILCPDPASRSSTRLLV